MQSVVVFGVSVYKPRSGMLFMPDISRLNMGTTIGLLIAVPLSNAEIPDNDKTVARHVFESASKLLFAKE